MGTGNCIFEAVPHAPMAHPVTHENVGAAGRPPVSLFYPIIVTRAPGRAPQRHWLFSEQWKAKIRKGLHIFI
jgi:hypothetical protein